MCLFIQELWLLVSVVTLIDENKLVEGHQVIISTKLI